MGRPIGAKNIMRTPKEKEKLVLEYFDSKVGYRKFAESYGIHPSIFCKWIRLYRESGIEGLKSKTDNPVNESLNGWIKEELIIDFDLKQCNNVPELIKEYIHYYNNERPSYALNYKTPIQYKIESEF